METYEWFTIAHQAAELLFDRAQQAVHGGYDSLGLSTQMRLGSFACIVTDETQPTGFSFGLYQDLPPNAVRFASLVDENLSSKAVFGASLLGNAYAVIETICVHCCEGIIRQRPSDPFFHNESGDERCEDPTGAPTDEFATPGMPE